MQSVEQVRTCFYCNGLENSCRHYIPSDTRICLTKITVRNDVMKHKRGKRNLTYDAIAEFLASGQQR